MRLVAGRPEVDLSRSAGRVEPNLGLYDGRHVFGRPDRQRATGYGNTQGIADGIRSFHAASYGSGNAPHALESSHVGLFVRPSHRQTKSHESHRQEPSCHVSNSFRGSAFGGSHRSGGTIREMVISANRFLPDGAASGDNGRTLRMLGGLEMSDGLSP